MFIPITPRIHTRYSNLSNAELLLELESIRHHSPIIQELCVRLEEDELFGKETNMNASCPICQGELTVDYCKGNDIFNLTIRKE